MSSSDPQSTLPEDADTTAQSSSTTVFARSLAPHDIHLEHPDTEPLRVPDDNPATQSHSPEEIPFDFQAFLDQMKTKSAEPVAKYLRRFAYF